MLRLAATAVLALVAASCGGGGSLSVAQYTEFCADSIAATRSIVEPEEVTWGELGAIAERSLERLDGVDAPSELGEFHRAVRRTLEFLAEAASEQPGDERVNPLALGFEAVQVATRFTRAVDGLPREIRVELESAGCL